MNTNGRFPFESQLSHLASRAQALKTIRRNAGPDPKCGDCGRRVAVKSLAAIDYCLVCSYVMGVMPISAKDAGPSLLSPHPVPSSSPHLLSLLPLSLFPDPIISTSFQLTLPNPSASYLLSFPHPLIPYLLLFPSSSPFQLPLPIFYHVIIDSYHC